jgi:GTP diphosphokinase / guanosine-3',5'-bis(diphosphate) 3'-diphosphatase
MKGSMLSNMIMLATYKHAGQLDKSGEPYILHPLTVMHLLYTNDEELQCIAVGHDLIEDTNVSLWELINLGFSPRIVDAIDMLSRIPGGSYERYKIRVKSNPDAVRVKLCDLQHNMDPSRKYLLPLHLKKRYADFFYELQRLPR